MLTPDFWTLKQMYSSAAVHHAPGCNVDLTQLCAGSVPLHGTTAGYGRAGSEFAFAFFRLFCPFSAPLLTFAVFVASFASSVRCCLRLLLAGIHSSNRYSHRPQAFLKQGDINTGASSSRSPGS